MRRQVLLASIALLLAALAALAAGLWLAARQAPEATPALANAGIIAGFGLLLVGALAWFFVDDRIARPAARLAAALRARAHGGVTEPLDVDARHLGDLGPAAAALSDRLTTERTDNARRIEEATRALEVERAQLAAVLSEIPVAIMLVDARNRVTLYDRQCVHVLGQVATLCLDRSVFEYLERAPLEGVLARLRADGGPGFIDTDLPTADRQGTVATRLRLTGTGYVLTMQVDGEVTAERPLVFDFALTDRAAASALADTPLSVLTYVVFDTETTGLDPARDEIVQIGAVRALNGRLVPGEVFDTLVDPGRPIPPGSSRVHGITDELVAGAPDVSTAVRQFHNFARDAVLVAHNAPFDLAFLTRHDRVFENPVLDTVLLSATVFGEAETHTLDAIADRLGVKIDAATRHTAMGDAVATAHVLLRLIPILEAKGVRTFGEAVSALRNHQRLLRAMEPTGTEGRIGRRG